MGRKPKRKSIGELLDNAGLTREELVVLLAEIAKNAKDAKTRLAATKAGLLLHGEATEGEAKQNAQVFNAPVMIIQGYHENIKALRNAQPQLSREEMEAQENARCQARLDEMKRANRSDRGELALRKGRCQYWNIRRGKPCTCGEHREQTPILDVQGSAVPNGAEDASAKG
jgi:hypothetical protein